MHFYYVFEAVSSIIFYIFLVILVISHFTQVVWIKLGVCNKKILNVENTGHLARSLPGTRNKIPQILYVPYYTGRPVLYGTSRIVRDVPYCTGRMATLFTI